MSEKVEIQCPECGIVFVKTEEYDNIDHFLEFYCSKCGKFYSEAEIRERCGL